MRADIGHVAATLRSRDVRKDANRSACACQEWFKALDDETLPEIRRSNLANTVRAGVLYCGCGWD